MRRFAKAAFVAALFSAPGAALAAGMTMPDGCQADLNRCSLSVWSKNSFPHPGVTQSATFSNGATLTCTSNGTGKARSCNLTPIPQQASSQGGANLPATSTGSDNAALELENALFHSGAYVGPLDGDPNRDMSGAIRQYQTSQGLPVTGVLDDVTRTRLGMDTPANNPVLALQQALFNAGTYYGPLDGDRNRDMSDAIRQYQTSQNLPVTGVLDDVTRTRLGMDTPANNPALALQQALFHAGTYYGPVDGDGKRDMSDAIKQYQTSQNLPVTGVLDDATRVRLGLDTAANNPALALQQQLFNAGVYYGPLDGDRHRDMSGVIKDYQRTHGLPITGVLDDATRARLRLSH